MEKRNFVKTQSETNSYDKFDKFFAAEERKKKVKRQLNLLGCLYVWMSMLDDYTIEK